jgi:hypothetical protein
VMDAGISSSGDAATVTRANGLVSGSEVNRSLGLITNMRTRFRRTGSGFGFRTPIRRFTVGLIPGSSVSFVSIVGAIGEHLG